MTKKHIDACLRESLEQYFKDLHGAEPSIEVSGWNVPRSEPGLGVCA